MLEGEVVMSGHHWNTQPGRFVRIRITEISNVKAILVNVIHNPVTGIATVRFPTVGPNGTHNIGDHAL
jgi:hypothetical protein